MPRRPGPPSPLQQDSTRLPRVHLFRDHPRHVVASKVRSGAWIAVRAGAYIDAPEAGPAARVERTLAVARIAALESQLTTSYVLSHSSAALLWGLPLHRTPPSAHVIQSSRPSRRGAADVVRHVHALPADHQTFRHGHPVTTLERTVVDCAMSLGPLGGLVVADAALHVGADRALCLDILTGMAGRRGVTTARAVLEHADGGAESAGETMARFVLLRAGLPVPETQVRVDTHLGTFWSDLGWREWRLLAEYDGRSKYAAGGTASEVVVQEKRRQDAVEESDWRVLRIVKEDLRRPVSLLRRVASHLPDGALDGLRPRRALRD